MKKLRYIIYLVVAVNAVIIFGWWLAISGLPATTITARLTALGRLTGLIAAYCALIELFLMSRLPSVEKAFGLEKLVKIHRWNGYIVFWSLIAHPVFLVYGYQINGKPDVITQFVDFILHYPDMIKALIGSILFLGVAGLSIAWARKRMGYELWYVIHFTAYLAIVLVFFHQLTTGGDFLGHAAFGYYWLFLLVATYALVAVYRFMSPIMIWFVCRPTVDRVVLESIGVYSIYISGRNFNKLDIQSGQYCGFQFLGNHLWAQNHPFTISESPTDSELRITFKIYGDYTLHLSQIKPGTPILIDGPRGNSTWNRSKRSKTLMIAGGIGITPFRALVESAPPGQDIVLIYACNNRNEAPLLGEFTSLNPASRVTVIPVFSNEHGRVTPEMLDQIAPDFASREAYLCGPDPMVKALTEHIVSRGVSPEDIHTERFAY